ncbi:MAG: hypothetical protein RBQ97_00720 [Acholeplasma sp.]|nr:hypothetical protein [Acholeplasma sp.]
MKTSKRDVLIIVIIAIIALSGFLIFNQIFKNANSSKAVVQYWYTNDNGFNKTEDLVEVDFVNKKVKKLNEQSHVPGEYGKYPIINEEEQLITVLGEFINEETNKRVELVIKYDFNEKSMQIVKEESPRNICSKAGISFGKPLICIPNQVKVIFVTTEEDVDGVIQ